MTRMCEEVDAPEEIEGLKAFFKKAKLSNSHLQKATGLLQEWGAVEVEEVLFDDDLSKQLQDYMELKILERKRFQASLETWPRKLTADSRASSVGELSCDGHAAAAVALVAPSTVLPGFGADGLAPDMRCARSAKQAESAEPERTVGGRARLAVDFKVKNTFIDVADEPSPKTKKLNWYRAGTAPPVVQTPAPYSEANEEAKAERISRDDEDQGCTSPGPSQPTLEWQRTADSADFSMYRQDDLSTWLPEQAGADMPQMMMGLPPMPMPWMWPPPAMCPVPMPVEQGTMWGPAPGHHTWMPDPGAGSSCGGTDGVIDVSGEGAASTAVALLSQHFDMSTGCMHVDWTVGARKLTSKDPHPHVSPSFELSCGCGARAVPFKMMICPKVMAEVKGGASFRKANGLGYLQVACEETLPDSVPEVSFRLAIGPKTDPEAIQPYRGPVLHNFANKAVGGLPKDQAEWDFQSAVDVDSKTFVVCLEIRPVSSA